MSRPEAADPALTILAAAFLALAVFAGGLGASVASDVFRAYRSRRLRDLAPPLRRKP